MNLVVPSVPPFRYPVLPGFRVTTLVLKEFHPLRFMAIISGIVGLMFWVTRSSRRGSRLN